MRLNTQGMGQWYNATRRLNQSLSNINKDANRSAEGIAKLTGSMRGLNQVIGFGKLAMMGSQLAKAIQSAVDMTETVNLFNVAMGDTAISTNGVVQEMSRLYGLDASNLQNSVGTFSLLARSMGMTTTQSSQLSTNMAKLAVDLSSLTNVPIQQVMADLKSGLVGQSETVYKYGMDVTEAGIKAEAMAQGITKSVRNMNQGEKMALRYKAMIRQTALAQGDFANTINSPANQLKILGERFITLGRSIGSMFIPMLTAVLPYLNAFVMILTDVANAIAKFFGFTPPEVKNGVGKTFGDVEDGADKSTGAVGKTTKAIKQMKNALMGFDEINLLPKPSSDEGKGDGVGGASILPKMDLGGYDNMMSTIKSKADELKKSLLESISAISDFVKAIPIEPIAFFVGALAGLWAVGKLGSLAFALLDIAIAFEGLSKLPIIGGLFAKLSALALNLGISFEALAVTISGLSAGAVALIVVAIALVITTIATLWTKVDSFRESWIEVWTNIKDILATLWNDMLLPIFKSIISACILIYEAGLKPLWSAWLVMWTAISSVITTVLNGIVFPLFKLLIDWIIVRLVPIIKALMPTFALVFTAIAGSVGGAFKTIGEIFNAFKKILDGVINFVTGVFTGNWRRAWQGVKEVFSGIFSGLGAIMKAPINMMIETVNGLIRGLNKIKLPDWDIIPSGMRGKGFSFPEIPKLARGGMLDGGGLFEAGENGKAEMIGSYQGKTTVMPLENTSFVGAMSDAVYGAVRSAMASSSGSSNDTEIVLQVGSTEFGRIAIDSINKITKQEGRLALNI